MALQLGACLIVIDVSRIPRAVASCAAPRLWAGPREPPQLGRFLDVTSSGTREASSAPSTPRPSKHGLHIWAQNPQNSTMSIISKASLK